MRKVQYVWKPGEFLSTPSVRRATIPRYYEKMMEAISIHALREEGDDKFKKSGII